MTRDEIDILAAEFVLGTLDAEARGRVTRQLSRDPALQEAVEAWRARLGDLEGEPAPVEPPAGLWDGIEAALDAPGREPYAATIRRRDGHWERIAEGVEKKVLFVDRDQGSESYLLRLLPGARLPAHPHRMAEECMMLEGEFSIGELRLTAGDYHAISAGTVHPEIFSETGGLAYIRGELRAAAG